MGPTTLSYALHPHVQAPIVSSITSIPTHQSTHSSYPYRYPPQSHYVQQQQYPSLHGLSRVTAHHNEYSSVKLEETGEPPVKFEDHADEWQSSHYTQHVDPIQPFVSAPAVHTCFRWLTMR